MASLLSAPLSMLSGGLQKAKLEIEESETFDVQFNPDKYIISDTGQIQVVPAKHGDKSIIQYVGGVSSTLMLTLYFDTNAKQKMGIPLEKATDVSDMTNKLTDTLRINGELHRPPNVTFLWGSIKYMGMVQKVNTTFTMFTLSGMPVRAKVDFVIQEVVSPDYKRWQPLQSPDRTKARILSQDTNIWNIANKEYKDISQWKRIAKANGIMNPLDIPVGTTLKVPALID